MGLTTLGATLTEAYKQYGQQILTDMVTKPTDAQFVTPIGGVNDTYIMPKVDVTSLIQAWQKDFTVKGGLTVSPIVNKVYKQKIDDSFDPAEFDQKAVLNFAFTKGPNGNGEFTPGSYQYERFILEYYMMKAAEEDVLDILFKGFRREPTAGTAGAAVNAYNGYATLIKKLIKSADIPANNVHDVATTPSTMETIVRDAYKDMIPEKYWQKAMQLFWSARRQMEYKEDYRDSFGNNTDFRGLDGLERVPGTNFMFSPMDSMAGSELMFFTPKSNIFLLYGSDSKEAHFENNRRMVDIMIDWRKGAGFGLGTLIFPFGKIVEPPVCLAPSPLATTTATVRWDVVPEATHYRISVDNNSDFSSPIVSAAEQAAQTTGGIENLIQTRAVTGLSSATVYHMKVQAVIRVGSVDYLSRDSQVLTFTTA